MEKNSEPHIIQKLAELFHIVGYRVNWNQTKKKNEKLC